MRKPSQHTIGRRSGKAAKRRRLKVLHCPTPVGGNPSGLVQAERELGLDSHMVVIGENPYGYFTDEQCKSELQRWRLLYRALRHYDVVHFNFGQSVLPYRVPMWTPSKRYRPLRQFVYAIYARFFELRDLAWLKRTGVKVVVTYQGDDARQGSPLRSFGISHVHEVEPGYYSDASDRHKRKQIATFDRYADCIYALNPDLLRVLPSRTRFVPYASVDPRRWTPVTNNASSRPLVVHAPTHRGAKGTRYVLEAVQRLQENDGLEFDFQLVEGLSQAKAREVYERADLLVDQLLVGWYGALAVELMALGKPVIAYIRDEDLQFVPAEMRADLPIINATPKTVYQVLKDWLTISREQLARRAERSRAFVDKWHDPLKIAAQMKQDYEQIVHAPQVGQTETASS